MTVGGAQGRTAALDRDPGIVSHSAVLPSEGIEESGLADIGMAHEGDLRQEGVLPGFTHARMGSVGRLDRSDADLLGERPTEGEARSANRTEQGAAVCDFAHPHLFAEADLP